MSIEAMKQALEALEEACGDRCNAEYNPCYAREAITSLRQAIERGWEDKLQAYIDIHDAVCRDNDRLYELLSRCEVEMRYAGWNKYESDNSARNGVYEQIKRTLYPEVVKEKNT